MRFRVLPIQPITIITVTVTITDTVCISANIFMLRYAILASIFHVNFNFLTNLLPKLLKRITNFILILFATQIVYNICNAVIAVIV